MSIAVMAIDPGPQTCGIVLLARRPELASGFGILTAEAEVPVRRVFSHIEDNMMANVPVVIEHLSCYGVDFSAVLRDTALISGEFRLRCRQLGREATFITRPDVKLHITSSRKTKDKDIRDALIERWGGEVAAMGYQKIEGSKQRTPKGPLYDIASHSWAALALGVTFLEMEAEKGPIVLDLSRAAFDKSLLSPLA